ncbi:MAG: hypothetical protein N2510_04185 [Ignavibacteria bacterium]|nr:hypothetical protein [Ignavibacteria bacterium]
MQTKLKNRKTSSKIKKQDFTFPLERENFIVIGIGILIIIIGYVFMSENSVDGFLPTVVAPILLTLGYCVIIPYGILKNFSKPKPDISEEVADISESGRNLISNVKTG